VRVSKLAQSLGPALWTSPSRRAASAEEEVDADALVALLEKCPAAVCAHVPRASSAHPRMPPL
jgi:hypothetical protein